MTVITVPSVKPTRGATMANAPRLPEPLRVPCSLIGYNTTSVWLRVQVRDSHRILTLPRSVLPRGFATADQILVQFNSEIVTASSGYVADVEFIEVLSVKGNGGEDEAVEAPTGAGPS